MIGLKMSNTRPQCESLFFSLCFLWSHSTICLCLRNNPVVQHIMHAALRHTGRDERSALAVNRQTRNPLTHQFVWGQCWIRLSMSVCACVCMCVYVYIICGRGVSVCESIKSVRYQQSTIHQMNKNNRSNPGVTLLLRWCHRKLQLSYKLFFFFF